MANGAWTLGEYPLPMVRVSCAKCGRAERDRKSSLLERYGPAMTMPDLRHELAQCPRRNNWSDPCMGVYRDWVER